MGVESVVSKEKKSNDVLFDVEGDFFDKNDVSNHNHSEFFDFFFELLKIGTYLNSLHSGMKYICTESEFATFEYLSSNW